MSPSENIYARFARLFVANRPLSLLIIIASFLAGIVCFLATPKQYNPEITLPAYRIVTQLPGATTDDTETLITRPLEQKIRELTGVEDIESVSQNGGISQITALFKIGEKVETSTVLLQQKIQEADATLPAGTTPSVISRIDPESVPVLTFAVSSSAYTQDQLRQVALDIKKELEKVPDATNITVLGGQPQELQILPDPQRMAARGVTMTDITRSLAALHIRMPLGTITTDTSATPLTLDYTPHTPELLATTRVGGSADAPVYLSDVADIRDGTTATEEHISFIQKDPPEASTVFVEVAKKQGSNGSTVVRALKAALQSMVWLPKEVSITILRDDGRVADTEISHLTEHLFLSIAIVSLALLYFLGLRAALVVATAIPLTLALVFIVGYIAHQNINRITLFALIFSLGLLVDDAIVVIENIYRRMTHDTSSMSEVAIAATGEVGMGVFLATITAVIVFLPMGFVGGMMGAYMGPIAFFAPVARLASLFVAYSISPFLGSLYLTRTGAHAEKQSRMELWYGRLMERIMAKKYLQRSIVALVALVTLVSFTLPIFELVHFRMLPKADREQITVYLDGRDDMSTESMQMVSNTAEKAIMAVPNVMSIEDFVGASPALDFAGLFRNADERTSTNQATLIVHLSQPETRTIKSEEIAVQLRQKLTEALQNTPDIRLKVLEDPPGPPTLATFLLRVEGPDEQVREDIARDIVQKLGSVDGIVDTDATLDTVSQRLLLIPDYAKMATLGISVQQLMTELHIALMGSDVSRVSLQSQEQNFISVRLPKDTRKTQEDMAAVPLRTALGTMMRVGDIAHFETEMSPSATMRFDGEPMTYVSAEMQHRSVVYAAKDMIMYLLSYHLPDVSAHLTDWNLFGFTYETATHQTYHIAWDGEFEMTLKNFRDLGLAMLVSFFLMYAVLVAQFRSFRNPLLIMLTIPLAFAGILPGFAVLDHFGVYFSATSMIGVIALGGIVVGNAILLLDFIEQQRGSGTPLRAAVIAACRSRVRPIFLTALTALLGSLVIVSDPVWSGLAWALLLGLTFSTLLTLVVFPIVYVWAEDKN